MKKTIILSYFLIFVLFSSNAQGLYTSLANRTTIPNFTFKDVESGKQYSFQGLLDQGKIIIATSSPKDCPYCHENIKSTLNSTVMSKYDLSKVAFVHNIYDCSAAAALADRNSMNVDGRALVYQQDPLVNNGEQTFIDASLYNPNNGTTPGSVVIDPITRKVVFMGGNFVNLDKALEVVDKLLAGTFVYPNQENNVAYGKPVTMPTGEPVGVKAAANINDGVDYSYAKGTSGPSFQIDFQSSYNINRIVLTGSLAVEKCKVSLSESPSGPWTQLAVIVPAAGVYTGFYETAVAGKGRYCKIESTDGAWNMEIGEFKAFTSDGIVDNVAPTAPSALNATAKSATGFTLNWTASTDAVGVVGYDVYKNGSLLGSTTTTTSYVVIGLTASTTYAMTVIARDAKPNYSTPGALSVTTNAVSSDITAPTAPSNLSTSALGANSFTLNWTASTDAVGVVGYDVYKAGVLLGSTTTVTTYAVSGLTASTSYSFTVKARDAAGNISVAGSLNVTTIGTPPVSGTIATWDLMGYKIAPKTGTISSAPVTTKDAGITVSNLTLEANRTNDDPGEVQANAIGFQNHSSATLAAAVANNAYIEFTITPVIGTKVSISSLDIHLFSMDGQENTFYLFSSKKGFGVANVIGSGVSTDHSVMGTYSVTDHNDLTTAVTFRIYISNTNPGGSNGSFAGIGNRSSGTADLTVNGSVSISTNLSGTNDTEFTLYPNPVLDNLNLKFSSEVQHAEIYILDLQGRSMIAKNAANTQSESLDVSNLKAGIYLVKVTADGKVTNSKFVKK